MKLRNLFKFKKAHIPELETVEGTYRFDAGRDHVRLSVEHGDVSVSESAAKADCVFSSSEEDFEKIASGEQNLLTAIMQGRVGVTGDIALAHAFHTLLRSLTLKRKFV